MTSSSVGFFGASIGQHPVLVDTSAIYAAMQPDRHPATNAPIDLQMKNQAASDDEDGFYTLERANLRRLFAKRVSEQIQAEDIKHLSVFALAPQPLLIELGRLLNEIVPATIHQCLREPKGWNWQRDSDPLEFKIEEPTNPERKTVALKLAVSAAITDDRVLAALETEDLAIWTLTVVEPGNDVVRRPADQANFRKAIRRVYARLQEVHGQYTTVNVFPALPASLAVEAGRVWMPKANLAMRIFDQLPGCGFVEATMIE